MNVWEKFKDHAKNRWTTRALGRHEGDGGMNHCALGIIGHTNIPDFDALVGTSGNNGTAYAALRSYATARSMVAQLAAALRVDTNPLVRDTANAVGPDGGGEGDQNCVMTVNDSFGREPLLRAADHIMVCEAWLEAESLHRETELAAEHIARMKVKKKDLRVEYQPAAIQEKIIESLRVE